MLALVGLVAGVLAVAAYVPYVRDVLRGKTLPHRTTWALFTGLNVVNVANQLALGATNSIWLVVGFTVASATVFVASIRCGVGGFAKLDVFGGSVALLGLSGWLIMRTPSVWLVANLVIATAGLALTVVKTVERPHSETLLTWLVGGVSSALAAVSVGRLNVALLTVPVYYAIAQLMFSAAIVTLRHQTGPGRSPH